MPLTHSLVCTRFSLVCYYLMPALQQYLPPPRPQTRQDGALETDLLPRAPFVPKMHHGNVDRQLNEQNGCGTLEQLSASLAHKDHVFALVTLSARLGRGEGAAPMEAPSPGHPIPSGIPHFASGSPRGGSTQEAP